jgi:actin-like ATPase involved in cell morphogenesis
LRYGVGIDLGTSFTSAAVSGPDGTHMVPVSPTMTVPSVAYPAPDGALLTGGMALKAVSNPALVARNFKRRLGDPTPLVLDGSAYPAAALMAAQLRDMLAAVTSYAGSPPESIVLTYPAIWGPYRQEQFTEVPKLADVGDFHLITEPEAAATHYSTERKLDDGEVVAVYDLGGGTFDTTILRMRSGLMEILGTPEGREHLGGIDFDQALLAHVDQRLDGAVGELDVTDPAAAAALAQIQAMCVRGKEELSTELEVRLTVPLPSGPREVAVTRQEFNEMIRPSVQSTIELLHHTMTSARLGADDLSAVLLAGGSSRVPLVAELVARAFDKPVRMTLHPKFTVALGAALVSTQPRPATATPDACSQANPAPDDATPSTAPLPPSRRRKRLAPAIAVAVVVLVGAVALFVTTHTSTPKAAENQPTPSSPLPIFDGKTAAYGLSGYVGSSANWKGTRISKDGADQMPNIRATPDPRANGVRVTWTGNTPAQFYVQSTNYHDARDISSYVANGVLVFDMVLHMRPTGDTTRIRMDCRYPCQGNLFATEFLDSLPTDRPVPVKIPLSCFKKAGLDPTKVNTLFVVYSQRQMDATFANVRIETHGASDPDSTPCSALPPAPPS